MVSYMVLYKTINDKIVQLSKRFNINSQTLNELMKPNKIVQANIKVTLSNGSRSSYDAFRVQHNNSLGIYKGGIRFNENVNLDECKALSAWMTYKCALQNLPSGGGKGGIQIDPNQFNDKDIEIISREFAKSFSDTIGEDKDVPAPDVGTNQKIMKWIDEELCKVTGKINNITGKISKIEVFPEEKKLIGYGVATTLERWAHNNSYTLKNDISLQDLEMLVHILRKFI